MENTLRLMNSRNETYRKSFNKVTDTSECDVVFLKFWGSKMLISLLILCIVTIVYMKILFMSKIGRPNNNIDHVDF